MTPPLKVCKCTSDPRTVWDFVSIARVCVECGGGIAGRVHNKQHKTLADIQDHSSTSLLWFEDAYGVLHAIHIMETHQDGAWIVLKEDYRL